MDLSGNGVLRGLAPDDAALIGDQLTRVDLPRRMVLEQPNTPIEHVYFLESGLASVIAQSRDYRIEVGLMGRDGMTGAAVVLGARTSPHETFIQIEGGGLRVDHAILLKLISESVTLHAVLLKWVHIAFVQASQTALANGRNTIEERLARWLLMAYDRQDSNRISLTHEFLSLMLGVHRPGVTLALHTLEAAGLIRAVRGGITVISRDKLKDVAGASYGVAEFEHSRLFASSQT